MTVGSSSSTCSATSSSYSPSPSSSPPPATSSLLRRQQQRRQPSPVDGSNNNNDFSSSNDADVCKLVENQPQNQQHQRPPRLLFCASAPLLQLRGSRLYRFYVRNFRVVLLCHLPLLLTVQWYLTLQQQQQSRAYSYFAATTGNSTSAAAAAAAVAAANSVADLFYSSAVTVDRFVDDDSGVASADGRDSDGAGGTILADYGRSASGRRTDADLIDSGEGQAPNRPRAPLEPRTDTENEYVFRNPVLPFTRTSSPNSNNSSSSLSLGDNNVAVAIPVVFVGGTNESMREFLDDIDRSDYYAVTHTVTYDPTTTSVAVTTAREKGGTTENWKQQSRWHAAAAAAVDSSSTPVVYIIDWAALDRNCHILYRILSSQSLFRKTMHDADAGSNKSRDIYLNRTFPEDSYFLFLDTTKSARTVTCPIQKYRQSLFLPTGSTKMETRYTKSSVVQGRYWNRTKQWTEPGTVIIENSDDLLDGPVLHAPQHLRETFVRQLYNVTSTYYGTDSLTLDVVTDKKYRTTHVAHFWRKGGNLEYAFLRRRISVDIVRLLDKNEGDKDRGKADDERVGSKRYRWLVRMLGDDDAIERNRVCPEYVRQLLSTRIVVVAQHDEWEDHFRLMESMASGALVMADAMLAPPYGLEDKVNIVFYDSLASFERLLFYYLDPRNEKERRAIARRGMGFALGRQRGWHRVEELLFGKALTLADLPFDLATDMQRLGVNASSPQ